MCIKQNKKLKPSFGSSINSSPSKPIQDCNRTLIVGP